MRTIDTQTVILPFAAAIENALMNVDFKTDALIRAALKTESDQNARWALSQIAENNKIARETCSFACQDTGLAVVFASVGQNLHLSGLLLEDAVNESVRLGYKQARKSIAHPLSRVNSGTNTPAVIHTRIVEGDALVLTYLAKGAGSENMSKVYMLTPSKGRAGIINACLDCVSSAGANPCPPIIIGLGIGGTMEKAALLSKLALTRETGECHADESVARLEKDVLAAVNALKIGAQGFGGDTTALSVAAEVFPTHIGMLPVAVNIQCHSVRHVRLQF